MKMATQTISRYCEECLKFRQKKCEGKSDSQKVYLYFGGRQGGRRFRAGLNFCKEYEFDVRLYRFKDGSGEVETIKHVRERQVKRDIENEQQEAFDDFDLGVSLNLDDFADFIEEE